MAQVTVRINGYAYTVGCQDGEEQHLVAMAGEVERRIDRSRRCRPEWGSPDAGHGGAADGRRSL